MNEPTIEEIDRGWTPPADGAVNDAIEPRKQHGRPGRPKKVALTELPPPAYQDSLVTLYKGNTYELLPLLVASFGEDPKQIDHIITDPPYSARVQENSRTPQQVGGYMKAQKRTFRFPAMDRKHMKLLAPWFRAVCKQWCLIFTDDKINHDWRECVANDHFDHVAQMVYWKHRAAPQLSGDRPAQWQEFIECFHPKGRKKWNGGGKPGRYEATPENWEENKAVKPIKIMREIVADFCLAGELVLDPFAGLGTTLVACKQRGVRAIGIEGDDDCLKTAIRRISQENLPFDFEPPKPPVKFRQVQGKIEFKNDDSTT